MKLGNPIKITGGVYQLRVLGARVTVVLADDGTVLVDTGTKGSLAFIDSGLQALGSSLNDIRMVVVTHYHPDHSGGLGQLVAATSAKVAAHRLDAGILSGKEQARSPHSSRLVAEISRPFIAPFYGDPVEVDYFLEDDDCLPGEEGIKVIHTPGHTSGSICLHLASRKLLIVGDILRHVFGRLRPPSKSVTQDPAQAIESLKKLLSLDFDTMCFGHSSPLRRDANAALERLVLRDV